MAADIHCTSLLHKTAAAAVKVFCRNFLLSKSKLVTHLGKKII